MNNELEESLASPTIDGPPGADGRPATENPAEAAATLEYERHAADVRLVQSIAAVGFDVQHSRSKVLIGQLAAYGAGTLINLWRADLLLTEVARRGLGRLPTPPPSWPDDAPEFLEDVAWVAASKFLTSGMRRWTPKGGASLRVFFVNSAFFEFKTRYVSYALYERRRQRCEMLTDFSGLTGKVGELTATDDVEKRALDRRALVDVLALAQPDVRPIVDRIIEGHSHKAIASDLGISVNTVSRRLAAYRSLLEHNGWITGVAIDE